MHNSQLQLQFDQLRAAQLHQRRLKLEIIERQTREKEELDAQEHETNDLNVLKRVHITRYNQIDDDDGGATAITKKEPSSEKRLLEARVRLFDNRDYLAFKTQGLPPNFASDDVPTRIYYMGFCGGPDCFFRRHGKRKNSSARNNRKLKVRQVLLIPSEAGAFP